MAKVKIPSFLNSVPEKQLREVMKKFTVWKQEEVCELLIKDLEKKLNDIAIEEEKEIPLSEFQHNYLQAKRFGKREVLRRLIDDLKAN